MKNFKKAGKFDPSDFSSDTGVFTIEFGSDTRVVPPPFDHGHFGKPPKFESDTGIVPTDFGSDTGIAPPPFGHGHFGQPPKFESDTGIAPTDFGSDTEIVPPPMFTYGKFDNRFWGKNHFEIEDEIFVDDDFSPKDEIFDFKNDSTPPTFVEDDIFSGDQFGSRPQKPFTSNNFRGGSKKK